MIMWRRLVLLVLSVEKTEVWQLSPGGIARRWQSLYLNSALLGTIPFATVPPPYWFWNPLKGRFVNEGFWVTISWDEYLSFHGYHLLYTFSSVLKNSQPLYVQILFLYLFLFPSGLLVEIYIIPSHYIPFFCFFLSFVLKCFILKIFLLFQFTNSLFSFLKNSPPLGSQIWLFYFLFFLVLEFLFGSFSDLRGHFLLVPYLIFKFGFSLLKHSKYSSFRVCAHGGRQGTIWSSPGSHCQFSLLILLHAVLSPHVSSYVLDIVFKKSFEAAMISSSRRDF